MHLASAMSRIGTETAFEVLVRARALEAQGRSIVHLEIGEPDFRTPQHIVDAAKQALDEGWTHYGPAQGLPELRAAIAENVSASRGIPVDPDRVCVVRCGQAGTGTRDEDSSEGSAERQEDLRQVQGDPQARSRDGHLRERAAQAASGLSTSAH